MGISPAELHLCRSFLPVTMSSSGLDMCKRGLDNEEGAAGEGEYDEEQL